ncbi:type IV secretory pathway VirB4 component [Ereboglobus sp. PH5-10]|uniref:VirB4 family type IV secretion system protein n=1 Tax=Ereboglobus sp. PH5-10 TaxID=2940629 RepID=UPI002405A163|nr:type IV secretion system DNA-binding domain-containing protein [Ereboglobus sp. PH5-10]MDF9827057.1 type IV secretory pathway VirB4 component [Ereboglobus sp. PH5-10]
MKTTAPNGHFIEGMILYGSLEKGGVASKGFLLQPPDLRGGTTAQLNAYQDKIRSLLAALGDGMRAQLQWTCNCDYRQELTRYHRETERVTNAHIRRVRTERFERYWRRMHARDLRREQLVLFVSTRIDTTTPTTATRDNLAAYYAKLLAQLRTRFDELTSSLRTLFGSDTTVTPMDDLAHFTYYSKFLNPSLADAFDIDFAARFNLAQTIQENCWCSDGVNIAKQPAGFYFDGLYHTVFTFKRWPSRTYPGIILRLTALPFLDYQITVNLEPLPTKNEVEKEERSIERLRGEYKSTERHSLLVAIGKKERKVESLSTGFIRPFSTTYIIRVWDQTEQALSAKCAAVKNAINNLSGAQYYECALPSTAKKLFFASWPGWTHSSYRHRNLYAEDSYLADLLPFSSTFTGHLAEAEAIYDGAQQGNLVGLRTFIGNPPTPQHAVLLGATGAGKSVHMCDLLEQTAAYYDYTVIIEEGLSYGKFTEAMGARPIILHPDGDLTINYLDTRKLPLNQLQTATAVALVSRMIGEASDEETQQIRQAILGQYISQLYQDCFEDWSKRHSALIPQIQRMACAAHKWKRDKMPHGTTDLESYTELRDLIARNDDEAQLFIARIPEADITAFLQNPQTERAVMAMAHAWYEPGDYPQHASLVELMQFSRFPEHKKETIDHIATLLAAWCAHGQYGRLFDGQSNISLTGVVAHFELGYIPEQAIELKTAAGLLINGFSRQHIISLPRAQRKRILYEELARFLDVPGGEKVVAESYAQLRKFSCWTASIVQQYSRFKHTRIRPVVIGNSKQFFLMRQFDRSDIADIARDISLPENVCEAIQNYPMPEQQPEGKKFSSICFFTPVTDPPLCGTVRNIQAPKKS